jgi:hypothetical protein
MLQREEKIFPTLRENMMCVVCIGAQKRDVRSFGILCSVKSRKIAGIIYTMVDASNSTEESFIALVTQIYMAKVLVLIFIFRFLSSVGIVIGILWVQCILFFISLFSSKKIIRAGHIT